MEKRLAAFALTYRNNTISWFGTYKVGGGDQDVRGMKTNACARALSTAVLSNENIKLELGIMSVGAKTSDTHIFATKRVGRCSRR